MAGLRSVDVDYLRSQSSSRMDADVVVEHHSRFVPNPQPGFIGVGGGVERQLALIDAVNKLALPPAIPALSKV